MKKSSLLQYFPVSKHFTELNNAIEHPKCKINITGCIGSSKAVLAASNVKNQKHPQLFILNNKEEANYFINDLEILINNEVFFYPASYRRAYQIEETDNSNILLRAEVLNKLNNKRISFESYAIFQMASEQFNILNKFIFSASPLNFIYRKNIIDKKKEDPPGALPRTPSGVDPPGALPRTPSGEGPS